MKSKPVRDLTILGDFLKHFGMLFVPFFVVGGILGFIHKSFLVYGLINPLIYSFGISLIILVINHDINDILTLVGFGRESQIALNARHAKSIQQIGYLMGMSDFDEALKKVNALLKEEPGLVNALSMKGQILVEGFAKNAEARECLKKVLVLTKPDEEQHKLANSLIVASYNPEEG